jgi:hypothetical protein
MAVDLVGVFTVYIIIYFHENPDALRNSPEDPFIPRIADIVAHIVRRYEQDYHDNSEILSTSGLVCLGVMLLNCGVRESLSLRHWVQCCWVLQCTISEDAADQRNLLEDISRFANIHKLVKVFKPEVEFGQLNSPAEVTIQVWLYNEQQIHERTEILADYTTPRAESLGKDSIFHLGPTDDHPSGACLLDVWSASLLTYSKVDHQERTVSFVHSDGQTTLFLFHFPPVQ